MCRAQSATDTMNNIYYETFESYVISERLSIMLHGQGVIDTGFHRYKDHWADVY